MKGILKRLIIAAAFMAVASPTARGDVIHRYDFNAASPHADSGFVGGLDVATAPAGAGGPAPAVQASVSDGAGTTRRDVMRFAGGATNFVYLRNDPAGLTLSQFSLSLWARTDVVNQGTYRGLFSAGTTANSFQVDNHNGQFRVVGQNGVSVTLGAVPQDRWQHLVVVFDGIQTLVYWNGALAQTDTGDPGGTFIRLCIGANRSLNNGFAGDIDDVRLYDNALDDAAIAAIYQGAEPAPILRHYYDFTAGGFADTGAPGGLNLAVANHNAGGGPAALTTVTDGAGLTRDDVLRFTGGDNAANWSYLANNSANFSIPFTVALWLRSDAANQGAARGIFNSGTFANSGMQLESNSGMLRLSGGFFLNIGAAAANRWQFIAATYDGQETAVWLDGVEANRVAGNPGASFTRIQLGVDRINTTGYAGDLDDAAVWHNALDATRIRALSELGRHPALRYGQGDAARLFELYATAGSQIVRLKGTPWEFTAAGLAGGLGLVQNLADGNFAIQLDIQGGGLRTLVYPTGSEDGQLTELMAINGGTLLDEDGDTPDWIEIHNRSTTQSMDLTGWYLTDDPLNLARWPFPPATMIHLDRYLVVFASDKNRGTAETELHANFRLDGDGEFLALVKADGQTTTIVHQYAPQFPAQVRDYSYGLLGGAAYYFSTATPGAPNVAGVIGIAAAPQFSVDRGFHDAPFSVSLFSETPGAAIRYTTDGSAPSATAGTPYNGPISISDTTVVRAVAYLAGWRDSAVSARSYIYLQSVIAQTRPADYPSTWAGVTADYDMDPDVIGPADLFGGKYRATIQNDLQAIPTLSVAMDKFDLFDPATGIYENPGNDGEAWERPASVELIRTDGEDDFQINCGIRITGGASRSVQDPKHSFRLLFKSDYGPTKLRYPLFDDQPYSKGAADAYDTIILRAGHNNTWHHWHYYQCRRALYVRDQFVRDTQNEMDWHSPHGMYVHLYVNGLYWGLYNATERATADFMTSYFGGEKEDYDTQNVNEVKDGDSAAWNTMMALANAGVTSNADYLAIQDYLDPANLADYMLINFYFGTDDWDGHNWYAGRKREAGAGYQFFCWDSEFAIARHTGATPPPVPEEPVILNLDRTGLNNNNKPSRLHQRCALNEEYRLMFADRIRRHMFNGGVLTVAANQTRWMTRANQVRPAAVAESARWGDYRRDVNPGGGHPWVSTDYDLYTRDEYFDTHVDWIVNDYLVQRHDIVLQQLRNRGLYPGVAAPDYNAHGGVMPHGFQLIVTNPNAGGVIYFTLSEGETSTASDPRQFGGAVNPAAQTYAGPLPLAGPTTVKARVLEAGVWSALNEAQFETLSNSPLRLTELHYHPAPPTAAELALGYDDRDSFEFIEIRNTSDQPLDITNYAFTDGIDFVFHTTGTLTTLAPGQYAVIVEDAAAFARRYPAVRRIAGQYGGKLDNDGERVTLRDQDGGLIHDFKYNDNPALGWPAAADGQGYSLEVIDVNGDYNAPANWRASNLHGGSPGGDADDYAAGPTQTRTPWQLWE